MKAKQSIEIRQMELADLAGIYELGTQLYTAEQLPTLYRCWDQNEIVRLFDAFQETCLVAVDNQRIVGFALGSIMDKPGSAWKYAWLEWLGVEPRYKRRRVAKRLVSRITELFVQRHARIMLVDTYEKNRGALQFFRKIGFGQAMRHVYLSMNLDDHPKAGDRH